ncbi:dipeptide/oligopeptide/nickel ABC transporter permease/ATP-binding protein [Microtetraspora niveoalba]|uniref:dipeptide/oligopeptide/nickel ABC transporter permease/ATP-binding protein n=1 Tax=Microtetraspora niveoalba TaxID=46175 RepID=UPI0009FFBCAC|nr:dipeptide/oligopeptide/nickel ABC transporter permease/ATP-binding protein [Microtetraspora niveoalba]
MTTSADITPPEEQQRHGAARRPVRASRLRRPAVLWCAVFLGVLVLVALAAPLLAPYDPLALDIKNKLASPSVAHWLGTDDLGRDVLSRLIYGARTSVVASAEVVAVALLLGVSVGLLVGYLGGLWDRVTMQVVDALQAVPALLLALAMVAVVGNGLVKAMFAVGLVFAVSFMRVTRAVVLAEREQLYVDAARVTGLGRAHIVFRQILPNVAAPLIVQASIAAGTALLIEASLSFLGVGIDTTQVSWGGMLETARQFQSEQPLLPIFPGVAIAVCVLLYNLLGDGLRDAVGVRDPAAGAPARSARTRTRLSVVERRPAEAAPASAPADGTLLSVRGLTVAAGDTELVSDVSFDVRKGETFGLVGESGCGKSVTATAVMGLLPGAVRVTGGSVLLDGRDLVRLGERELQRIRGERIGMVFQDPVAALSPSHTVGHQLGEALMVHKGMTRKQAAARSAELLSLVGVPDARRRLADYPHQFSGGMAQRVVIAAALACEPELLIADEPTTALDVTIQAQVLDLLDDLKRQLSMSVLLITHDLGVVADVCDRVAVMYAGQVVEVGSTEDLLLSPRHPYSEALLAAMPHGAPVERLATIPGRVPPAWDWPSGCRFHPRCPYAVERCGEGRPEIADGARCVRAAELTLKGVR